MESVQYNDSLNVLSHRTKCHHENKFGVAFIPDEEATFKRKYLNPFPHKYEEGKHIPEYGISATSFSILNIFPQCPRAHGNFLAR